MKTVQKYIRMSPRKLRLVANAVRKLSPEQALQYLKFTNKAAAKPMYKAIKAALSNAKTNFGAKPETLTFAEIDVQTGFTIKRFRAVSRGQAHRIMKRTSHIRVVLKEKNGTKS
ncbi:MAG: 50S ribosomal protein L22 [Candidatus Microgenomates bacterium]